MHISNLRKLNSWNKLLTAKKNRYTNPDNEIDMMKRRMEILQFCN